MSDDKKPARKPVQISPANMLGCEFARNVWCISVENWILPDDLKEGAAYASITNKLRIGDHLEVMPEDGTWWAHLIVRNVERGTAKVGFIQTVHFDDAAIPSQTVGSVEVKWRGPKNRFGVVRTADNHVLQENLQTRTDAVAWAAEHERNFAA